MDKSWKNLLDLEQKHIDNNDEDQKSSPKDGKRRQLIDLP